MNSQSRMPVEAVDGSGEGNPTLGSILWCLFSKSPKSGTANLFAKGCKRNMKKMKRKKKSKEISYLVSHHTSLCVVGCRQPSMVAVGSACVCVCVCVCICDGGGGEMEFEKKAQGYNNT